MLLMCWGISHSQHHFLKITEASAGKLHLIQLRETSVIYSAFKFTTLVATSAFSLIHFPSSVSLVRF